MHLAQGAPSLTVIQNPELHSFRRQTSFVSVNVGDKNWDAFTGVAQASFLGVKQENRWTWQHPSKCVSFGRIRLSSSHRNASIFAFPEPSPSFWTLSNDTLSLLSLCPDTPCVAGCDNFRMLESEMPHFLGVFFYLGKPSSFWTRKSLSSPEDKPLCTDACNGVVWHLAEQLALGDCAVSHPTGISCHLWNLFPITFANSWRLVF